MVHVLYIANLQCKTLMTVEVPVRSSNFPNFAVKDLVIGSGPIDIILSRSMLLNFLSYHIKVCSQTISGVFDLFESLHRNQHLLHPRKGLVLGQKAQCLSGPFGT